MRIDGDRWRAASASICMLRADAQHESCRTALVPSQHALPRGLPTFRHALAGTFSAAALRALVGTMRPRQARPSPRPPWLPWFWQGATLLDVAVAQRRAHLPMWLPACKRLADPDLASTHDATTRSRPGGPRGRCHDVHLCVHALSYRRGRTARQSVCARPPGNGVACAPSCMHAVSAASRSPNFVRQTTLSPPPPKNGCHTETMPKRARVCALRSDD